MMWRTLGRGPSIQADGSSSTPRPLEGPRGFGPASLAGSALNGGKLTLMILDQLTSFRRQLRWWVLAHQGWENFFRPLCLPLLTAPGGR
eukprot:359332-Chlamydomonas_euryale.AAC.1